MGCQNVNLNQVDSTESVQITSTTDTTICEENTTTVMNTENKMIHEITCEGAKANGFFSKTVTFKMEEVHDDDLQATIDRDYWYDSVKILDFVLKDEAEQATADFQTNSFSVKVIKDANYHVYYADGASMVELNSSFENGYVTFQPNPGILRYVLIERTKSGFRYEDGIWYMDMEGFWFTPGQWPSDIDYIYPLYFGMSCKVFMQNIGCYCLTNKNYYFGKKDFVNISVEQTNSNFDAMCNRIMSPLEKIGLQIERSEYTGEKYYVRLPQKTRASKWSNRVETTELGYKKIAESAIFTKFNALVFASDEEIEVAFARILSQLNRTTKWLTKVEKEKMEEISKSLTIQQQREFVPYA